jgi:hypothetical protein
VAATGRRTTAAAAVDGAAWYVGFTEATTPRHLVLPATTSVPLVVKILDSAHRPPAFVMGARGSSMVVEGDCAPSSLEVVLPPLGAYRLLGLPMAELSGQLLDLVEVLTTPAEFVARAVPSWWGWGRQVNFVQDTVAAAS